MNNKDIQIYEGIIEKAAKSLQLYELARIDDEMESAVPHVFSESFEERIEKLIRFSRKSYFSFVNTVGKRIAVIILAVFISLSLTVINVKALREPIQKFIIEIYEKFIEFIYPKQEYPKEITEIYTPTYLPNGYKMVNEKSSTFGRLILYMDANGRDVLFFQQRITKNILWIGIKEDNLERLIIGNYEALFTGSKIKNKLIWQNDSYGFRLESELLKEEMIKIAESIIVKK